MQYSIFPEGGSKVTVEGLSADVVLTGSTVTVRQGTKVVQSVDGAFLNELTQVYGARVTSIHDWTTTTRNVSISKGDIVLAMVSGIGLMQSGGGASGSSSITAPNCTTLFKGEYQAADGQTRATVPLKISILKADEDTSLTLSAYCGAVANLGVALFYVYKLN